MTETLDPLEYAARAFAPKPRRYPLPGALARALDPMTRTSPALDLIDAELSGLAEGRTDHEALAILMPPQEGKSERVSRRFPTWLLDHDPSLRIAIVSYQQDMAVRWGRVILRDIRMAGDRLSISLQRDSAAAARWDTYDGGGVYCVGIGGPLTGKPVDILIIDDPVKDRAAAESQTIRDSTWDWWESVALTRLAPGSRVVLVQCMTGDTPVLMGDGSERPLADVRPGDTVATYEDGRVTTATVRNWANQGPDQVFSIKMTSGRVVKANARHPFLTVNENGAEAWQRTDTLRPGTHIRLVTGANGAASRAPNVTGRPSAQAVTARACACPATTSSDGQGGYARPRSTRRQAAPPTTATDTASAPATTIGCSQSRAASVRYASSLLRDGGPSLTTSCSASITTTARGRYAACCATVATSRSDTREPLTSWPQPLSMCAIGLDEVAGIVPCGTEDVYDLQVDRTENFIANGLAAHNTRWHEDDLAGRIAARPSPLRWRTLSIPAIARDHDPLGRQPGEELASVRGRAEGHFARLRAGMSAYVFSGVYQQDPVAPEGNFFRRQTFRYWRPGLAWADGRERIDLEGELVTLEDSWRFITVDVAASVKTAADWTVASCWAMSMSGDLILLDRARDRIAQHDHFGLVAPLRDRWGADVVYVERSFYASTLVDDARAAGVPVAEVRADTDKVTRAIPAAGRVHAGRVWFPAEAAWLDEWTDELAAFPSGAHDDQVDTLSYAARIATAQWTQPAAVPRPGLSDADRAVAAAHRAATGDGTRDLDIMHAQW